MLRLIISGCNGHMGRVVTDLASRDPDIDIVAGFEIGRASCRERV